MTSKNRDLTQINSTLSFYVIFYVIKWVLYLHLSVLPDLAFWKNKPVGFIVQFNSWQFVGVRDNCLQVKRYYEYFMFVKWI